MVIVDCQSFTLKNRFIKEGEKKSQIRFYRDFLKSHYVQTEVFHDEIFTIFHH